MQKKIKMFVMEWGGKPHSYNRSGLSQPLKYTVGIWKEPVSFSWRKTNITIHKCLYPAREMKFAILQKQDLLQQPLALLSY
jgi:hypothetical protein